MSDRGLRGAHELAKFIRASYSGKVVEVGAGYQADIAERLKGLDLVVTDCVCRNAGPIDVRADDIFNPDIELYSKASLLYSIRPPLEMQLAIGRIALLVGADVLIRPLGYEIADLPGMSRRLVNKGDAAFYLFKKVG